MDIHSANNCTDSANNCTDSGNHDNIPDHQECSSLRTTLTLELSGLSASCAPKPLESSPVGLGCGASGEGLGSLSLLVQDDVRKHFIVGIYFIIDVIYFIVGLRTTFRPNRYNFNFTFTEKINIIDGFYIVCKVRGKIHGTIMY